MSCCFLRAIDERSKPKRVSLSIRQLSGICSTICAPTLANDDDWPKRCWRHNIDTSPAGIDERMATVGTTIPLATAAGSLTMQRKKLCCFPNDRRVASIGRMCGSGIVSAVDLHFEDRIIWAIHAPGWKAQHIVHVIENLPLNLIRVDHTNVLWLKVSVVE
jgi:hypothetical protein